MMYPKYGAPHIFDTEKMAVATKSSDMFDCGNARPFCHHTTGRVQVHTSRSVRLHPACDLMAKRLRVPTSTLLVLVLVIVLVLLIVIVIVIGLV